MNLVGNNGSKYIKQKQILFDEVQAREELAEEKKKQQMKAFRNKKREAFFKELLELSKGI